ncbi:MAG: hypothetical protein CMH27_08735 [Micavibrio sp.]|nr:hypothetical protein [Micavibrio sp.]|tara:strand:- start:264 stop:500 length:237 start_codon:yes stop_codon:yes gene_type:complete
MSYTYLESDQSSIAGIKDAGNLKGSENFKRAARRQAARVGRPIGEDLGRQMMEKLYIQAANWPEINPSHEEELHHEAA